MTAVLEHATLADVNEPTRQALATAADAYAQAPATLKAAILAAARSDPDNTPAKITRAIGHVYTYDYVARLIRQDREKNPGLYA
jgi:hypothetical protein